MAAGVWARTPLYPAFRESLPDLGFGPLDRTDAPGVDAWVREATGGLIPRLPVELRPDALLVLVNALHLRARWQTPFDAAYSERAPFTDASGRAHQVMCMIRSLPAEDVWRVPGRGADVVELPCGGRRPVLVRCVLGQPGAEAAQVLAAAWAPAAEREAVGAAASGRGGRAPRPVVNA